MRASDVMTKQVLTVKPHASVREVAALLSEHGISGVPVIEDNGRVVGIVSEGDLLHRTEIGTDAARSGAAPGGSIRSPPTGHSTTSNRTAARSRM